MTTPTVLKLRPHRVVELKWESLNVFTLVLAPLLPPPAGGGSDRIVFQAGQWVYLHLLNEDGSSWARAAFSIASAPEESGDKIELGIKIAGEFTKRAGRLQPDDRVALQGPFGVFTLREGVSPVVMFAGGIGVTPFRSMVRSLAAQKADVDVILFYSNKAVEESPYLEELQALEKTWPRFRLVATITQGAPRKWTGETGRLNDAMVERYVSDFSRGEFLMCGPAGFMDEVRGILERHGVDVKTRVRRELFG